jgi:hypothetical protein
VTVAAAGGLVLAGVVVFGGGGLAAAVFGQTGVGETAPSTPTLTPAPTPSAAATQTPARDLPPGVSADGDIDAGPLVAAHYEAIVDRSYRLTLTYREAVAGEPTGLRQETVWVEDDRYLTTAVETGRFRTTPTSLVTGDSYANATTVAVRTKDGVAFRERRNPQALLDGQTRLLGYYLSVESSSIVGATNVAGDWAYWLTTDGDPWPGVTNATGSVLVGRDGLVYEVQRRYDDPDDPEVTIHVTLRIERVGTTTVDPPTWYRNATARRAS